MLHQLPGSPADPRLLAARGHLFGRFRIITVVVVAQDAGMSPAAELSDIDVMIAKRGHFDTGIPPYSDYPVLHEEQVWGSEVVLHRTLAPDHLGCLSGQPHRANQRGSQKARPSGGNLASKDRAQQCERRRDGREW